MSQAAVVIDTPVGPLLIESDDTAITKVWFVDESATGLPDDAPPVLVEAVQQLDDYFDGSRSDFDLALSPQGTDFQRRVWAELEKIPYGETASYGEIADRLGMPSGGSRAVGLANGSNPIAIVVPCHRVIGANGSLTGYAGGLERKRFLLDLESQATQRGLFSMT